MSAEQQFATPVVDLLEGFGRRHARRMFGLIADGSLYLKADEQSRPLFVDEDSAECLRWARIAFDAALRNLTRKRKRKP